MKEELERKRKAEKEEKKEQNLKVLNEFKGLSSLSEIKESPSKKQKLKHSENIEVNNLNNETELKKTKEDEVTSEKPKITKKNYILVENINESVTSDEMKNYLSENGISFNKVVVLPGSLGIANFQRQKEIEKLFNVCQGIQYKTNELFIFKSAIDNVDENFVSNLCETSVHLKNLDLAITEEDITSLLPESSMKNISINSEKGTAIIDFVDNVSAKACVELLDNKTIGEKVVRASFLVKTQRPDVFTLKVSNLPKDVTNGDVQTVFPKAMKIKLLKKKTNQCLIHFKTAEDLESVLNSENEFFVKDNKVTIEQLTSKKIKKSEHKVQYILNLFNLPFDTTVPEIKEHYPEVRYIEMLKNESGMFAGSVKLMYNEKQACEDALKKSKGLSFKHRRVRAEMKFEEGVRDFGDKTANISENADLNE